LFVTMPADDVTRLPAFTADEGDSSEVIVAEIVDADEPAETTRVIEVEPERRRSSIPGLVALLLAVATEVVTGIAVGVATGGDVDAGTALGYTAIGMSVAAILLGLVAVLARLGRTWGVAAIVLGVLANPWLQLVVLRFISGSG
jgi:hypothetical protein